MGKVEDILETVRRYAEAGKISAEEILRRFPELKESEDERIRKMLVEQMKRWKKCAEDNNVEQDVKDASDAIAYLEKQKEQKPIQFKDCNLVEIIKGEFEGFRSLLKKRGIDYQPTDSYWESFARLFDSSAREYLKEQKSALEQTLDAYKISDERATAKMEGRIEGRKDVINNPEEYGLQKPVEWSEDDIERMVKKRSLLSGNTASELHFYRQGIKDTLKSRLPQKKQEWSEEDEANFKWFDKFFRAESVIANGRDIPQDKYLWFKSLRPQKKWKPSEEQMDALRYCCKYWSMRDGYKEVLESLYNDLKKLMENEK